MAYLEPPSRPLSEANTMTLDDVQQPPQSPGTSVAHAINEGIYLHSNATPDPEGLAEKSYLDDAKSLDTQNEDSEFHWIELTFDTEIPELPTLHRTQSGLASVKSAVTGHGPPDLKHYASPFGWSRLRKGFVLTVACIASGLAAYAAGSYSMATSHLREMWGLSQVAANVGTTMFVLGFGFAPLILAPYSEVKGRYWTFVLAGVVFFLGTMGCAVTQSFAGMLVSRFIVGSGASVYATLVGGVVSDIYHKEERNMPMALYSLSVFIGTGLGPLVSGAISDHISWRWIFYIQMILVGANTAMIFFVFQETRGNVLLHQKATALNKYVESLEKQGHAGIVWPADSQDPEKETGPQRVRFRAPTEKRRSFPKMIYFSFKFPLKLLATESVVFWFSLWVSFAWAILYMQFSSIALVFRTNHGFNNTEIGAVFSSIVVAAIIFCTVSVYQEKLALRYMPKIAASPEGRLYFACVESAFLPIGLFWFGWTSFSSIHWIAPTLAIASCTIGIFSIYLAVFNYLADTYHRYASSALAAQSMCRNLLAGVFPLVTNQMFTNLTYSGAGSLLGGIGVLLTAVPWVLVFYGERIRRRSPFAGEVMEEQHDGVDYEEPDEYVESRRGSELHPHHHHHHHHQNDEEVQQQQQS